MVHDTRRTHVLAGDGLDDILWRRTEELCDDRELVDVCERDEEARNNEANA